MQGIRRRLSVKLLDNRREILLLLVIIGLFLALKLALLAHFHDTRWDESVYIGMGKYIATMGEKGLWEIIRPLGLPLLYAPLYLIGLNMVAASQIVSIVFSALLIFMTYLLAKKASDGKTALISALLVVTTPIFFYNASYGLTHIPAALLSSIAIYSYLDKRYFLSGLSAFLAFFFRYTMGLMFVAIMTMAMLQGLSRKSLIKIIVGFSCPFISLLFFNWIAYGNAIIPFYEASLHQGNMVHGVINEEWTSHLFNIAYYPITLLGQNIVFICLAMIPWLPKREKALPVLVALGVYALYLTIIINKQERFILDFLPFASILAAMGLSRISEKISPKLLVPLVILAIIPSMYMMHEQYLWTTDNKPEIFMLYEYFADKQPESDILTMTPLPIAYSEIKMIPLYNNVDYAFSTYLERKEKTEYLVYTSNFYPCFDIGCMMKKDALFRDIENDFTRVFNMTLDQEYIIYHRKR
jgi:hypothetical protein